MHKILLFCTLGLSLFGNAYQYYLQYKLKSEHRKAITTIEKDTIVPLEKTVQSQTAALAHFESGSRNTSVTLESYRGRLEAHCRALENERKKTDAVRVELQAENAALKQSLQTIAAFYEKLLTELPALKSGEKPVEIQQFLDQLFTNKERENVELQAENSGLRAQILQLRRLVEALNAAAISGHSTPTQPATTEGE